jgi:hypothetical protein
MSCPDCERFKISASMWRNEAYKLGGTPLPWDAEELIKRSPFVWYHPVSGRFRFDGEKLPPSWIPLYK